MIIIEKYIYKYIEGRVKIIANETVKCPVCDCKEFNVIGWRERKVINTDSEKITLYIRRLRCNRCGTIHHELPDFVVPYKMYCKEIIEKIITDDTESIECEASTIKKVKSWWLNFQLILQSENVFLPIKRSLELSVECFCEIIRVVANAHLWKYTRLAYAMQ